MYYRLPYALLRIVSPTTSNPNKAPSTEPRQVLVLGAGVGSDVFEAVRQGASEVDAVEIDPAVIELGRKFNPVYSNPTVHVYCDDGRDFINHCRGHYDLIIFGCLDSIGLSGIGTSMRTDSYIHTADSYRRC